MMKEPDNDGFFYSQIGALEAEVERVKKENHNLQQQNDIMARILRQMIQEKEKSNGKS
jgi:regulator of replication initiation timing